MAAPGDVAVGAIERGRHLIVAGRDGHRQDAGVPRARDRGSGKRVVVATATKALQDQLAAKDLPFLERAPRPSSSSGRC
jgi:ATP-dependent DNA helicase DinG